jgi:hypothetical protein
MLYSQVLNFLTSAQIPALQSKKEKEKEDIADVRIHRQDYIHDHKH